MGLSVSYRIPTIQIVMWGKVYTRRRRARDLRRAAERAAERVARGDVVSGATADAWSARTVGSGRSSG
jgi:hypothetical protein